MPRPSTLAAVVLAAALLPGCGRETLADVDLAFRAGDQLAPASYPDAGMRFQRSSRIVLTPSERPGVFRGLVGDAFIAGFAYRRAEQLPRNRRELAAARRRLVAATRKRGRDYQLRSARATRVDGAPAVELLGDQSLSTGRLRTRSLHVYKGRAEYVVELGADPADFAYLDRAVYRPIRRTLRLTGRVRRR